MRLKLPLQISQTTAQQAQPFEVTIHRPAKGRYKITGEINVRMEYKDKTLLVTVVEGRNLAAAEKKETSNPFVKLYLLPDRKSSKKKTKVDKKTLNPLYNQTFKVYEK